MKCKKSKAVGTMGKHLSACEHGFHGRLLKVNEFLHVEKGKSEILQFGFVGNGHVFSHASDFLFQGTLLFGKLRVGSLKFAWQAFV